ncbi:MAG TPA: nuclear transport factor 2 family protein [Thermoleophilaceae bacterium]|nr:nuclear transport factor 2 family protein [Thermoleophilaceae bacterium]
MSGTNVEAVRQIYEGWARGDFRAGVSLYDPDVVLVLRPEFPEAGTYRGPEEIRRYMREDFLRDLDEASIAGNEFLDAGDCVVVHVTQRGTGPGSRLPVAMSYYQVWTLRDGLVVRIESIRTRREALEAAGL